MWRGLLRFQCLDYSRNADHNKYTKWDVNLPRVKIPFGFVGLGQAFTYTKCKQSAVIWRGKESFALIKATKFFNPSLALSGYRSFTDKPQVLTVMHSSSRCTNIWEAFSLDKQYLTAWKPTAVLLLRFPQTRCVKQFPAFLLPAVAARTPSNIEGHIFTPAGQLKDERYQLNPQLYIFPPQALSDFTFQTRFCVL